MLFGKVVRVRAYGGLCWGVLCEIDVIGVCSHSCLGSDLTDRYVRSDNRHTFGRSYVYVLTAMTALLILPKRNKIQSNHAAFCFLSTDI